MERAIVNKAENPDEKPNSTETGFPVQPENEKMSGGEILICALLDEGVDTIFGFPGGVLLHIYDVIYHKPELRHILIKHEQGGTHAADGYARATGKAGVVLVTSGPGATNTVTGIATAFMDSIPLIILTGQVPFAMMGNDAFQEADIIGVTRPITKHSYLVRDVNELGRVVQEAFHIATTGKPGPVLIDLPKDMVAQKGYYNRLKKMKIRGYNPVKNGHFHQIVKAADAINKAKKPVFYVGGGVNFGNASAELTELVEKSNIPVTTTLMGLGAVRSDHPLNLGMLGMHGTWAANMAVSECDLLIAVGSRFDDRVTGRLNGFSVKSKKIHIDIDPASISKNVTVDIPIVGDVKNVLPKLTELVERPDISAWLQKLDSWKEAHPLKYAHRDDTIMPQYVIEKISEITNGDAIVVTDVGQHQMWTAQFYKFNRPRSLLSSGGLGTMGYGFPAAVGAAVGRPDRKVFCIAGDGGFQMTSMELATAVKYKIPVKLAIINNSFLGMVRQWQQLFFDKRYSHTYLKDSNPDFVKLAESYGATAFRIQRPREVVPTLQKAMEIKNGPVVMDFIVAKEANVFPMVPAGAALYEMIEDEN